MPISPTPEARGLTHSQVAAISKRYQPHGPHIFVAKRANPVVSDEIAIEWIREAVDKGYDVGWPRDRRGDRGNNARR